MANTILRLPTVQVRTGLSRSTIYLHIAEGNFPQSLKLGARAVGWLECDIEEWIKKRAACGRKLITISHSGRRGL